jgi:hypothetical protein
MVTMNLSTRNEMPEPLKLARSMLKWTLIGSGGEYEHMDAYISCCVKINRNSRA